MPFNVNDLKGSRSEQLRNFCRIIAKTKKTPDLVNLVAEKSDYIGYCRKITNAAPKSRQLFRSFCLKNSLNIKDIQMKVSMVATILGVYKQVDYYSILGIPPDADDSAIKQAYRKKAQILHPDKREDHESNDDDFIELQNAYSHLIDPELRKVYDATPKDLGAWKQGDIENPKADRRHPMRRFVPRFCLTLGGIAAAVYLSNIFIGTTTDVELPSVENQVVDTSTGGRFFYKTSGGSLSSGSSHLYPEYPLHPQNNTAHNPVMQDRKGGKAMRDISDTPSCAKAKHTGAASNYNDVRPMREL